MEKKVAQNLQENGPATVAVDQQLCFAVYSAAHAFNRAYKPLLEKLGLTYPQYLVLLVLWQGDGITVKAIGDVLGLDSGTLSPLLKRLEATGLISRNRDGKDERQVFIVLTDKGRALEADAANVFTDIGLATGCSQQQVDDLRSSLQTLSHNLASATPVR
ncbi:MarR family transcriptional regulator [Rhizobium sp. CFBP 8762]|uniref:MarR family winged helix-turn-helix transcriptional regulator n=1 Tax=Rhizobium sp. CFBP 8762 TaxID=2775279 RepID=UPI00178695DE|nr:MarR family transcriptional regulator [Rhizobium sp. CFBP 8762]MBD8556244.1 MarR family transcriptional regulator [Rhizobium sp. CFBP 8762]